MVRAPCCDKANVKRGPWSPEEDARLKAYIHHHGTGGNWISLPQRIGLKRCGKSCRLRWLNYLRPNLKHGSFSEEEDNIICSLYLNIGSRWSIMAAQLPGRTDNDIKNYWNSKLKKKLLGKQRKEQSQAQAHNVCSMNQEIKRESENSSSVEEVIMSQTPYCPIQHSFANVSSIQQDYDLNNQVSSSLKSLLTKLGGVQFSYDDDLQQLYTYNMMMMSSQSSYDIIPSTIANSTSATFFSPSNMFQEFGYFPIDDLSDLVLANGSSSMTSTESTGYWEDINSFVYSPLVSNY